MTVGTDRKATILGHRGCKLPFSERYVANSGYRHFQKTNQIRLHGQLENELHDTVSFTFPGFE